MRDDLPGNDLPDDADLPEQPDADAGLTRAERRAKGKKGVQQQAHGKQHFVPKSSGGHAQRMWSNRRAG
jgi:hypothetical protein